MAVVRRAVIDIGTNSVKLLVADVDGSVVVPLLEDSDQTRLGKGFYETHRLQEDAVNDTAAAVAQFVATARLKHASSIRLIATSAARDATNKDDLVHAVQVACGIPLEIISGQQEAQWAYQGVRSDPKLARQRLLILDAGGGSTEFIIGEHDTPDFTHSFPLGSVRMLERLRPSDPPTVEERENCRNALKQFFAEVIHPVIDPVLAEHRAQTRLIGTGGAATILARMEYALDRYHRDEIDGARLPLESLTKWVDRLWSLPLRERKQIVGLPKKRADIVLTGAAIYEAVVKEFGFLDFHASTRGLRFAAILDGLEEAVEL